MLCTQCIISYPLQIIMSRKRTDNTAYARLRQDYLRLKRDPVPYITAEPLPANILEWYLAMQ